MPSRFFKKSEKFEDEEYENQEDNGNFSYNEELRTNEFNDATIEYGDGEEIEEEEFYEKEEIDKNKMLFYGLIAGLILIILIVLLLRGCVLSDGTIKSVKIEGPDIIYVDERSEVKVSATGSGNLKNTIYHFDTSNNSIVEIEKKGYVKGKTAINTLIPITTGRFVLQVSGELDDVKLKGTEKEIVICRNLSEESFSSEDLTAIIDKPVKLNIDLGEESECYENLKVEIADNEIAKIDNDGNLVGVKVGTTKITFTNDGKNITKTIKVAKDGISVEGIKLDKSKITLTVGEKTSINASITPSNATNTNVSFETSNSGVVTVSKTGKLTAVGKGNAIITATTEDGGYTSLVNVIVEEKKITTPNGSGNSGNTTKEDKTAPKLTKVTISSSNTYSKYAKKDDVVTLEMTFDEELGTTPSVIMDGRGVTTSCKQKVCQAKLTVVGSTTEGEVKFNISSYKDKAGNTGVVRTTTTDGSKVIVDRTSPVCYGTSIQRTTKQETVKFVWYDNNNGSGIRKVIYPDNKTTESAVVGEDKSNTATFTFDLDTKTYSKAMKLYDWAGNYSTCSYTILPSSSSGTSGSSNPTKTYTATFEIAHKFISKVSFNSASCSTTTGSCEVTLPDIDISSIYNYNVGWCSSKTCSAIEYKSGTKVTISKDSTFYAVAFSKYTSGGSSGGTIVVPTDPTPGDDDNTCVNGKKECSATDSGAICSSCSKWSAWKESGSSYRSDTRLGKEDNYNMTYCEYKNNIKGWLCQDYTRTCAGYYYDCKCPC